MNLAEKVGSMISEISDILPQSGNGQGQNPELLNGILVWVSIMCILLFLMMGADKRKARNNRYRISEKTLFTVALLGGALGGWLGMKIFHHKTRHWYFRLLFPLITLVWAAALIYLKKIYA